MEIRLDDPRRNEVANLLREHLQEVTAHAPPESTHALDIESLCSPRVTFWTAWDNNEILGCGALLELDSRHGEIKSMRTANDHLRKGVASTILKHIIEAARQRSYTRLSLETGSMQAFLPARELYYHHNFVDCDPFANYRTDPHSVFMTLRL